MIPTETTQGSAKSALGNQQKATHAPETTHLDESEESFDRFMRAVDTFALSAGIGLSATALVLFITKSPIVIAMTIILGSIGGRYLIKRVDSPR